MLSFSLPYASRNLYEESASIAEKLPGGDGYRARSCHRLGRLYAVLGDEAKSQDRFKTARDLKMRLKPSGNDGQSDDSVYDELVLWMLW